MRIDKRYKLEKGVAKPGDTRFATEYICVDPAKERAYTTNGITLACVPIGVDTSDYVDGPNTILSVDAYKAARKASGRGTDSVTFLRKENGIVTSDGAEYPSSSREFPRCEHVLESVLKGTENGQSVALNAELLHKLVDALGSGTKNAVLTFQTGKDGRIDPLRPIKVEASVAGGLAGEVGVIMPLKPETR